MLGRFNICATTILRVSFAFLMAFGTAGSIVFVTQPAIADPPDTLFFDDFSDGNDDGWTHFTFSGLCGTWDAAAGVYDISNYVGDVGSCTWTTSTFSFAGYYLWTDYTMSGHFRHNNSRMAVFFIVRSQDDSNSYRVGYSDGNWTIDRWVGGSPSTILSTPGTLESGLWYYMQVRVEGSTISLLVDGVPKLEATDATFPNGAIGLEVEDCRVSFDDIAVTASSTSPAVTLTQLTTDPEGDGAPDWSPLGDKIAFSSYRTWPYRIWVIPSTGGTASQLSDFGTYGDAEPKWSPDASHILFQSRGSRWDLYTMTNTGGDTIRRTSTDDRDENNPDWSPDASRIVYRIAGNPGTIVIRDLEGGEERILAQGDFPSWSPDGDWIAYNYQGDIYVIPAAGGDPYQLTSDPADDFLADWSPDGRWIAFVSRRSSVGDIWIMDSRGEDFGLWQITASSGYDDWPSWSPGGEKLVFSSDSSGNPDLWIASCLPTTSGHVNHDCVVDIGDVVYLISYLFRGGPAPDPSAIGDVNRDDVIDVGDVVYLVSYLYKGGPPPASGSASPLAFAERLAGCDGTYALRKTAGLAQVRLLNRETPSQGGKLLDVDASFGTDLAGVQLELSYDAQGMESIIPELTDRTQEMKLFFTAANGTVKIGIVDLAGDQVVPAGEGPLVRLRIQGSNYSSLQLNKAILVDEEATPFSVAILPKEDRDQVAPRDFVLSQNHPNPFNPETEISYTLAEAAQVKVSVYNMLGQKVKTLVNEHQAAGCKTITWDGTDECGKSAASGIYFYRIKAGEFEDTKKMILMK